MTQVSQAAGPKLQQARPLPARAPEPAPADARAMKDALAAARGRMGPTEQSAPREAKAGPQVKGKAGAPQMAKADTPLTSRTGLKEATKTGSKEPPVRQASTDDRPAAALDRRESRDQIEGFALPGQPGAPAPLPMPAMPSPQAHPGAFAQMLADLWTRENGKGAKEVSVRFGERSWPATGARLVRNAAGALDITLLVGDGGRRYGGGLPGLESALAGAGVDLGALEIEAA